MQCRKQTRNEVLEINAMIPFAVRKANKTVGEHPFHPTDKDEWDTVYYAEMNKLTEKHGLRVSLKSLLAAKEIINNRVHCYLCGSIVKGKTKVIR